jgi:SAM-dependent methyltransferase
VLDLGCGSARLLARLATGRPDITITGVDLSGPMLTLGQTHLSQAGVAERVRLHRADITSIPDELMDGASAVSCSLTLHHLPSTSTATACLKELARARARYGSAIWVFDFCRLRDERIWPVIFRPLGGKDRRFGADAINSERAAFTEAEVRSMLAAADLRLHAARTRPLPVFQAHWAPHVEAHTPNAAHYAGGRLSRRARLLGSALRLSFTGSAGSS